MNLPMSWLNDYMDIDVTPKEYSDRLTMTGSKVEGWENMGESVQNVVAGKVLTCEDHPDSDHLHVCTVDAGTGEILQIVCGAPNVKAGIIVPVALVGAVLPDGKIKKGKLRGVESYGMLCSHDELGITEDMLGYEPEYGILILPDDTKIGTDIKDIFGMNETVVEFEITSNRPDCFSIIGLARETAASFNKKFTIPEVKFNENSENIADTISVDVQDKDKCKRYCARMVKNVKIGPSPSWMQERLRACGVRPINNIVDITNYVLLEYGQPMHAFDLRDLQDNKIIVRRANDGEVIKTLDEQDRTLTSNDLVIADGGRAVAIAGVMAMEPKCIVLDEPTAMLDPNGRKEVLHAAHELNRKKGVTILLITHYMEEVVDADYVYVMDKGHVVMQGTPREIFSQVGTLKEHRLDVPQITLLADLLRQSGLDIPLGVLTREELVDAIMKIAG